MLSWEQRFEEFADRKQRDAVAARLSPLETLLDDPPPGFEPLGNPWTRRLFGGDFYLAPEPADVPATSLVFVQSKNGNTGAANPASLGGGETDRHLIYEGLSRVAADAVLAGGGTVRGTDLVLSVWRPELVDLRDTLRLPRHPTQIVTTLRGLPFDDTLLFNIPGLPVIVLTVHSCADHMRGALAKRPWITVIEMGSPAELRPAFERIRAMGIARLSCVGGRTIARALLGAGLVQDVYLTTAAREGGEPDTPLAERPLEGRTVVSKRGTGPDEGIRFEHLALTATYRPSLT